MNNKTSIFQGKYGPLLIAEIGGNHEGNFEYAKKLTQLAIETKVDFIKFQLYTGDTIVSPIESPKRNKHFKKFELSSAQYIELAKMVEKAGIGFTASVWNHDFIEWIDPFMPIYKIGSGDMTAYPLLETIASLGKPIILSTGLSNEEEVIDAVRFIQNVNMKYRNSNYLAILQCTSMYPIDYSDANLSVINCFKNRLNLTVGYSDHTVGSKALKYAYAMGAQVLEFHFTDSREGKTFRDHKVSLTPEEVRELIEEIKIIKELKGDGIKRPLDIEKSSGHTDSFRRAIYPAKDLSAGHKISLSDLVYLRPLHGIDAKDYKKIIGRELNVDKKAFESLKWNDLKLRDNEQL